MRATALSAVPEIHARGQELSDCVDARAVYSSPDLEITHWHCLHDGEPLRVARRHNEYVLTLIQRGACQLHADGWTATVDAATALLHRPGPWYRTSHPFGFGDAGFSIRLDRRFAEDILVASNEDVAESPVPTLSVVPRPVAAGLRQLVVAQRMHSDLPVDRLLVEEVSAEIYRACAEAARGVAATEAKRSGSRAHRRLTRHALEFLQQRYCDPIGLDDVATSVGVSVAHLCRVFRAQVGVPLYRYVRRLRLAAALDAVLAGAEDLTAVALDSGFYSHSHMTSTFQQELGASPSDLRNAAGAAVRRLEETTLFGDLRAA